MKSDRFVKVMLVVIVLLLAANCLFSIRASWMESSSAAVPPAFLQVGKEYRFDELNGVGTAKVLEIQSNGWVKVVHLVPQGMEVLTGGAKSDPYWINTNSVRYVVSVTPDPNRR